MAVDPGRSPFPVLVGGGDDQAWAVELTADEALALAQGVQRLADQHRDLEPHLMEEESLELEWETSWGAGSLWLSLEGGRRAWRLRFVLTPAADQRAVEGSWGEGASRALAAALAAAQIGRAHV